MLIFRKASTENLDILYNGALMHIIKIPNDQVMSAEERKKQVLCKINFCISL